MKPTITTWKSGGKISTYIATIGRETAEGKTRAEAIAACERNVLESLERLHVGTFVSLWREQTIVIAPGRGGWEYWFTGLSQGCTHGGYSTSTEARRRALYHCAQNLWTVDVADDGAFVEELTGPDQRELVSWCTWQRRMSALMATGLTSDEARAQIDGRA